MTNYSHDPAVLMDRTDSSKRAVEAADNVVHAYDLNMQMPETPLTPHDKRSLTTAAGMSSSANVLISQKRERSEDLDFHPGPPLKRMLTLTEAESMEIFHPPESTITIDETLETRTDAPEWTIATSEMDLTSHRTTSQKSSPVTSPPVLSTKRNRVIIRDFMRFLVADIVRSRHSTSQKHTTTESGKTIEIETLGSRGEVQQRKIHLTIESDVPQTISTQEQHLQFALQKVIDNAIKFTESGIITITVKLAKSAHVIEIWVVDAGCGIAEDSQSSIFQPHFQEDASIRRSRDGLGLSLFNAKAHVRKNLGGDVTLERSATEGPSKGSEFLIRLPISIPESGDIETLLTSTPVPSGPQSCRPLPWADQNNHSNCSYSESIKNILTLFPAPKESRERRTHINRHLAKEYPLNIMIAEDNPINRNVAVGSLSKLGYSNENITVAFDGLEAVRHYEQSLSNLSAQRFDAILMDIWMPNMDGYEATRKIMELAQLNGEKTKIVAVTADITEDSVQRTKDVGMQGFLAKPYKVLDIEHLIVEHFTKCQG